ncbi:MAG TPA: hypothetical protein V6C58_23110, partial [Allocoleopsis sp.]
MTIFFYFTKIDTTEKLTIWSVNMSLGFSYYSAAVAAGTGNGVVAGLFVPVSNLPGFLSSEFSESIKDLKAAFS